MATIKKARQAQWPLVQEWTFAFGDSMVNTAGVLDPCTTVADHAFDVIGLPPYAIVIGGSVTTETTFTGATAVNVIVGDSSDDNRYLTTTDKVTAGYTALVPTGYVGTGQDLRVTISPTAADVTAGKITVRVEYVVRGRGNENQIT